MNNPSESKHTQGNSERASTPTNHSPDHAMNHQDLLEYAALEVLGVLDAEESERFDRAYAAASPEVQAQIRLEQTRLVDLDELLPTVRPPTSLRANVINAVMRVANAGDEAASPVAAQIIPELSPDLESDLSVSSRAVSSQCEGIIGRIGVTPIWRAAAIALGAATLGLAGSNLFLSRQMESFSDQNFSAGTVNTATQLGGSFARLMFNPSASQAAFTPAEGYEDCEAMIMFDADTRTGILAFRHLPATAGRPLALFEVLDDGSLGERITTFPAGRGLESTPIQFGSGDLPRRLAIVMPDPTDDSQTILLTATLA